MVPKLLAVALCLTGLFPQRACCCAPTVVGCAAEAVADHADAHDGCCCDRDASAVPPCHRHERHRHDCPVVALKRNPPATPPNPVTAPGPDGPSAPSTADAPPSNAGGPNPVPSADDSPPHVPLFLSLRVLRN